MADSTGLVPFVDGVVLSVRFGSTTQEQLRTAAVTLERVRGNLLGLVLNIVPLPARGASSYGYEYRAQPEKGLRT